MNDSSSFQRIEAVFKGAVKLEGDARHAFLEDECQGDAALRAQVEALLSHDDDKELIDPSSRDQLMAEALDEHEIDRTLPRRLGRYSLNRLIGRGGMGSVYEAEQDAPHRTVALKLIETGGHSRRIQRRFEQEAEVLGRLQHPGIAQVYDAGTLETELGPRPFIAMELIEGLPITQDVRERNLELRDLLHLIIKIADAVQHAHHRGVIHRDLKPANILVDHSGQPKILDFGVARVTDADLRTTTLQTQQGQIVGTVAYMSPEQASGDPTAIDTRSDVYSIGVIAYELLTGQLPISVDRMMVHEAVRAIREDEPTQMATIVRGVPIDVRTIIGKALEKEKSRRYRSAAALADDLERWLRDEPISARPPSTIYQLGKFARRHKPLVIGTGAVFATLVVALVVVSLALGQARRDRAEAQRQAAIAQEVNAFLNDDVLSAADPWEGADPDITVREALDRAAGELDDRFVDEPVIEASVRQTIGKSYSQLGLHDVAEPHLRRAVALLQQHLDEDDPRVVSAGQHLGELLGEAGEYQEAESLIRAAYDFKRATLDPADPEMIDVTNLLGLNLMDQGRFGESLEVLEQGISDSEGREQVVGPLYHSIRLNTAALRYKMEDIEGAEALYKSSLEACERDLGPDHPETIAALSSLALVSQRLEKFEQAEEMHAKSIEGYSRILGPEHPYTLTGRSNYALMLTHQGKHDQAEPMMRDILAIRVEALGPDHPDTLVSMALLIRVLRDTDRFSEAESIGSDAYERFRRTLGAEHPYTKICAQSLQSLYDRWSKPELAAAWRAVSEDGAEPPPMPSQILGSPANE